MRAAIALALAALLSGCATTPTVRTVTNTVMVPVACDPQVPAPPTWAVDALPLNAEIDAQMRALRVDRLRAKGYIGVLEAAVNSCR